MVFLIGLEGILSSLCGNMSCYFYGRVYNIIELWFLEILFLIYFYVYNFSEYWVWLYFLWYEVGNLIFILCILVKIGDIEYGIILLVNNCNN